MTYYDFLNLPRDASEDEIVKRCRHLLIKLGHGRGDSRVEGLTRHVIKIQHVLTQERGDYDRYLAERDRIRQQQGPPEPVREDGGAPNPLDHIVQAGGEWIRDKINNVFRRRP